MNDNEAPSTKNSSKQNLNINLDLRLLVAILVAIIIAMLLLWQPWTNDTSDRTISVTGQAIISAEPDEYVFNPSYTFDAADKQTAIDNTTAKSNELVAELKEIGVADNQIETNASGNDIYYLREPDTDSDEYSYYLRLTVTVNDKDLAQQVQDFLITTEPTGSITPYVTFSEPVRTELESTARDRATKDARKKAEQSADNLGFKLGDVKSVNDGAGFGIMPHNDIALSEGVSSSDQLQLQPGENDINYSVTVVYFVK